MYEDHVPVHQAEDVPSPQTPDCDVDVLKTRGDDKVGWDICEEVMMQERRQKKGFSRSREREGKKKGGPKIRTPT